MRLARRKSLPRLPNNLRELATLFDDGQLERFSCCEANFFRCCVQDSDGKTNIIFACTQLIHSVLLNDVNEIHADATFKVIPANMGYQLLVLHCMVQNYSIPIIYVLMESKTRRSYECIFQFVKNNLLPTLRPNIIITDYETALRDVLLSVFPGAQSVRCWFHHNQAVWRKVKKLGYLNHINNNDSALKALKLLMCLPLLLYYQRYWLRNVGPHIISVYGLPRRTNNNVESFHNSLKVKFGTNHPSLWIFLDHLTNLNKNYHIIVNQLHNNLNPTRHLRFKFLANSLRIKNATQQLNLGLISSWQFLQRCSYVTEGYERRQRIWALRNNEEMADEGQIELGQIPPDELPLVVELNVGDPPARRPRELPLDRDVSLYYTVV
eukprot:XP_016663758.1 PREDICTED: uncharacterized protein LOC100574402 [Acyrthosiphon pisum]